MNCPKCGSKKLWIQKRHDYRDGSTGITYQCADCKKYFTVRENSTQVQSVKQIVPEEGIKGNGKKRGVSLDEIIKTHDVEELIKSALGKLEKGTLFTEAEFIDLAGLRGKQYRAILESSEMKIYKGKIEGTIYYGVPEDMEVLRNRFIIR